MHKANPKIDLVFKKIFGTEQNKGLLKALLNAILPENEQVESITIKNPYNEIEFLGDKLSVVDIKARDKNGIWYDVEIQINEQKYYGKRAIFYQSELYSKQIAEGESYDNLRKTVIINILDFNYFKDDRYFRRCSYKDFETNQFYKELDFADLYFIELRKFDNAIEHIKTALDRWILFLNKATELDKNNLPTELKQTEIIEAIDTIEKMSFNEKERDYYDSKQKVMRDEMAVMQTVYEKGIDMGKDQAKIEFAKQLKALGKNSIEEMMILTGLSKAQIDQL